MTRKKLEKFERSFPQVVLLGRANVGKSTLYNKLSDKYESLVSNIAGTTRDIKKIVISWQGTRFTLVDTGGLTTKHLLDEKTKTTKTDNSDSLDDIDKKIVKEAIKAVKRSSLILFVVDTREGIMPEDRDIVLWLQKRKFPFVLVANKADKPSQRFETQDFLRLGIDEPIPVSASTGIGTGDLLDYIVERLDLKTLQKNSKKPTEYKNLSYLNVAIIGKPNVGKSTLLNTIIGEERAITSSTAHTTREPIDTEITYDNHAITLVDTAGIRKKANIAPKSIEKHGVAMSLRAMKRSDVILLVVDGAGDIGRQDLKLAQEALKNRVSIIIAVNKIDKIDSLKEADHLQVIKAVQRNFNFIKWAPVVLLSAKTSKNVHKVLDMAIKVYSNRIQRISQEDLRSIMEQITKKFAPPKKRGAKQPTQIIGFNQTGTNPPHFEVVYKGKGMLPITYLKRFDKGLREMHDFSGTPIIIHQNKVK